MARSLLRLLWIGVAVVLLQPRYSLPQHLYVLRPMLRMAESGGIELRPEQPAAAMAQLQFRNVQGKDLVRDVQQLFHSFYQLLHSAGSATTKRPKWPPYPYHYKPFLDRLAFGNLTLNLAFTFNFENTNTFG